MTEFDDFHTPRPPVLAQLRYREHADRLRQVPLASRFEYIYRTNLWGSDETRSGLGSGRQTTALLRSRLLAVLRQTQTRVLLDVPCGDFNWIADVADSVDAYIGGDIVGDIVDSNKARFEQGARTFRRLDLTRDALPACDLVLCRDCLVHLSFANVSAALVNIAGCEARWMVMTTFPGISVNVDIDDGDWRPLNFERAPFGLPPPRAIINEGCEEAGGAYSDKSLGLWKVTDLMNCAGATRPA
jgi:hypothetical protein